MLAAAVGEGSQDRTSASAPGGGGPDELAAGQDGIELDEDGS